MKIAVTMPGLIGDLLYSIPTARHISKIFGVKIDFWTANHCSPAISLLKQQSFINEAFISKKYVPQHNGCGTQPWELTPEQEYDRVFHLGLRDYPQCSLVEYFPKIYGLSLTDVTIKYDFEPEVYEGKIVVAPGRNPLLKPLILDVIKNLTQKGTVYQVGPTSELIGISMPNLVNLDLSMADTLPVLANADLFIGTLSANLVLANGFDMKKIVIVEPERHCAIHDIQSIKHHYIVPKTAEEILRLI